MVRTNPVLRVKYTEFSFPENDFHPSPEEKIRELPTEIETRFRMWCTWIPASLIDQSVNKVQ